MNDFTSHCSSNIESCRFSEELNRLKLEVAHLGEMVRTDALTGLFNYRYLSETLPLEMERVRRGTTPLALIMVDIDFFKKLNDTYGHEIGNMALVHIANLIRLATRKLDMPCRFGGEEFVILLPNTELLSAVNVGERLREMILRTPLEVSIDGGQISIPITASLGIDIYSIGSIDSPEGFLARADSCLYEAKQTGRNRTVYPQVQPITHKDSVSADEKEALFNLFSNEQDL